MSSELKPLIPRQPVPSLQVQIAGGGIWRLSDQTPQNFSLILFYRGHHCPICASYLKDTQRRLDALAERGVETIAISSDPEERAQLSVEQWGLDRLKIGYGLTLDAARDWGLFISTRRSTNPTPSGVAETNVFSEPGMFLVRPDGTLYFSSVQTMPFTRPSIADVVMGLDVILREDYPARGEVVDHRATLLASRTT